MTKYIVKCDFCKKTMRTTDDLGESASGGTCKKCHDDYTQGYKDLLQKHLELNRGKPVGKGRKGQSLMP
jgi:hypothetical protein